MPHLDVDSKVRAIRLYYKHNLHWEKNRFEQLRLFCAEEDIVASTVTFRSIIKKWETERTIATTPSPARNIAHTKVTEAQLQHIEELVYRDRNITAPKIRSITQIDVTVRTIQNYLRLVLGA